MRGEKKLAVFVACLSVSAALMVFLPTEVGAASWKTNVLVNEPSGAQQRNPQIAVGPDGILHAAWVDYRNGPSNSDIYYTSSGDNGTSFSYPNIVVNKDSLNNYTQGSPDITVSGNGTAVIAWSEFQGKDTNIMAARKAPSSDEFEQLGRVNAISNGTQERPSAAARGARVAVVWKDGRSDNAVRIWNSTTGALVREMAGHNRSVTSVDFSPDGTKLAAALEDGLVKVWDSATGALLRNISGHTSIVTCVAWSPDGTKLASGSWDHTVKVWSASTYSLLDTFKSSNNPINSLDWSPNGTLIAVAHNGEGDYAGTGGAPSGYPSQNFNVTLWNVSMKTSRYLGQHTNSVSSVAFSTDGRLLASSSIDISIMVWNTTTGNLLNTIYSAGGAVNAVAWGPSNTLAAGLANGTIDFYPTPALGNFISRTIPGHLGDVTSLDWQGGNNRLASGSADSTAKTWVGSTGAFTAGTGRMPNTIHSVKLSPNGNTFATGSGNSILYHKSESHVWCAVSPDNGKTWPVQTRVDSVGAFELDRPRVAIGANGDIGVAWHEARAGGEPNIFYSNSTDGGLTFANDSMVSTGTERKYNPSVAMDASGVAHMVWHDEKDKASTERFDIYYCRSDNMASIVRVNATAPTVQQQDADVGVSDSGLAVVVCWREENIVNSIKVARSANGGTSFAAPDTVNDVADGTRWVPSMCLDRGQIHIAWEDYRRGDPDIFFSTTVLVDAWPPRIRAVSPAHGSTSVSVFAPIALKFTEPVNRMTFMSAFQIISVGSSWTGAQMNASWSPYGDAVELEPHGWHLSYFTSYTVVIAASVEDLSGNVMASSYTWSFTTGSDVDAPKIELLSAPASIGYDEQANITASVIDYTGISAVLLYYKLNGTSSFASAPMVVNTALAYEAVIPAQQMLGTMLFYIWSNDTVGNAGSLPANLTAGNYMEIDIVDGKAPLISTDGIAEVEFDQIAVVNVTVADGIGIAGVYLEYNTVSSDATHVSTMTQAAGGKYTGTIPAQGDIGQFSYRAVATDTSNNTGATTFFTVQSVDSFSPVLSAPVAEQQEGGSILVAVTATDNHELQSVTLHFIPVGGSRYIEKDMSPGAGGSYSATILEQEQSGTFKYYINATDPSGNVASTLDMNDGNPYKMWVDGKLPPLSVILVISLVIIAAGLVALFYLLKRRRRRPKSGIVGQPEHPLESVNTPANGPMKPVEAGKPPKAG